LPCTLISTSPIGACWERTARLISGILNSEAALWTLIVSLPPDSSFTRSVKK
jgi:hypothetical protein